MAHVVTGHVINCTDCGQTCSTTKPCRCCKK
jgi:hypothetical protein